METPFTATIITYKEGQIRTRRQTIARASDGSTYVGFFDRDGRLFRADIDDVASDRHIPLFASGEFSYTNTLSTPSRGKSRRTSIDQVRARVGVGSKVAKTNNPTSRRPIAWNVAHPWEKKSAMG